MHQMLMIDCENIVKILKVPVRTHIHPCREVRRDFWLLGVVNRVLSIPLDAAVIMGRREELLCRERQLLSLPMNLSGVGPIVRRHMDPSPHHGAVASLLGACGSGKENAF